MQSFHHQFSTLEKLKDFIDKNTISTQENILLQIFSSVVEKEQVSSITKEISKLLPLANVIGSTTAGNIFKGKMYDDGIIVSISVFDKTVVKSQLYKNTSEEECAKKVIEELVFEDTKALIVFSDGLQSNGEAFLAELSKLKPNLLISGGRAGDDLKFKKTFVFDNRDIVENGFVVASLSGKDLIVNSDYILNWQRLGIPMMVTKADKNRLYEINNTPVVDIYKKYLGEEIYLSLPESAIEFPFIIKRGSTEVARAPVALLEDNSLLFGGNIELGEEVTFAFGNADDVKNKNQVSFSKMQSMPIESIFVYSCSVRKHILGEELGCELETFSEIASTAGFFTYGEFLHSESVNELLNITTTYLTLSESKESFKRELPKSKKVDSNRNLTALSHLVSVTSNELIKAQEIHNLTQNIVKVGSWEWDIKSGVMKLIICLKLIEISLKQLMKPF